MLENVKQIHYAALTCNLAKGGAGPSSVSGSKVRRSLDAIPETTAEKAVGDNDITDEENWGCRSVPPNPINPLPGSACTERTFQKISARLARRMLQSETEPRPPLLPVPIPCPCLSGQLGVDEAELLSRSFYKHKLWVLGGSRTGAMNVTRRRVRGKKEAVYNKELLRVLSAKIVCVCVYIRYKYIWRSVTLFAMWTFNGSDYFVMRNGCFKEVIFDLLVQNLRCGS